MSISTILHVHNSIAYITTIKMSTPPQIRMYSHKSRKWVEWQVQFMNIIYIYTPIYHSFNSTTNCLQWVKWKSRHNSRIYIYICPPKWSRSAILPIQLPLYFDKIMDNTIILDGYIITHIFVWVSKYPSIIYWVLLISVSFHPRQEGREGLVIHPFSKHPMLLYT
jgi:hypothetical protein